MGRGGRGEGGSQAGQRWERWVGGGGEPVAALDKSHTAKPQKAASRAERKQGARPRLSPVQTKELSSNTSEHRLATR